MVKKKIQENRSETGDEEINILKKFKKKITLKLYSLRSRISIFFSKKLSVFLSFDKFFSTILSVLNSFHCYFFFVL